MCFLPYSFWIAFAVVSKDVACENVYDMTMGWFGYDFDGTIWNVFILYLTRAYSLLQLDSTRIDRFAMAYTLQDQRKFSRVDEATC